MKSMETPSYRNTGIQQEEESTCWTKTKSTTKAASGSPRTSGN